VQYDVIKNNNHSPTVNQPDHSLNNALFEMCIYTQFIGGSRIFLGGAQGQIHPDVYWLHTGEDPTVQVAFLTNTVLLKYFQYSLHPAWS